MEYLARFLINAIGGSIVTFYVTWLFVTVLYPFVRLPRARYYLLLLPFLKVFYDLLFMNHTSWVFYHGKKILGALPGSRQLMVYLGANWKPFAGIRLQFFEGETFSIGDLFVELFGVPLMFSLSVVFLLLTLLSIIRWISQWIASKRWQASLTLIHQFDTVYSTLEPLKSPLLIGARIVIPYPLFTKLNPQEMEAIQTHEKEHLRWKDNETSLCLSFLATLFWFIPCCNRALKQGNFYRELKNKKKA
ncbi:MAG: hypothetical protein KDK64_04445, partial [Chlamydiia bacterium]|nr:hypothetical protein [Chlamydiia bacterium]